MNRIRSYTDYEALLRAVNTSYPLRGTQIRLHRDMIGRVYFIDGSDRGIGNPSRKAVLKLYRGIDTESALRTVSILRYLEKKGYPVVSVIRANEGEDSIVIDAPDGPCVGILYDYVEGTSPDDRKEIESIGAQVATLHNLMDEYPAPLPRRTKAQYIDDYIAVMREMGYAPSRVSELAEYGDELWGRLERLPKSFCHGDMHTGNMLRTETGCYVLFDFDEASGDFPAVDVAYLSDATNFNRFDEKAYEKTTRRFERFYRGYSRERSISDGEIAAVFDIIAVRHYTILGRIIRRQGTEAVSAGFFDQQREWLLKWRNLCEMQSRRA